VVGLLGKVAELERTVVEQRAEIARLKGLKGPPLIKPSGMAQASRGAKPDQCETPQGRGKVNPRISVEDRVLRVTVPVGSCFKGYESYLMQELVLSVHAIRYRRERWVMPDGKTIVAPLPQGTRGHFGPDLRRFVLMQYHQGQSTLPRVTALLQSVGVSISKREVQRLLTEHQDDFLDEAQDVLRAGLARSSWISVDDTGARHKAANGFCTQIGNDDFTWFGTRTSKSRLNFLDLLRAGHSDFVLNDAAFAYMRSRALPVILMARLAAQPETSFADHAQGNAADSLSANIRSRPPGNARKLGIDHILHRRFDHARADCIDAHAIGGMGHRQRLGHGDHRRLADIVDRVVDCAGGLAGDRGDVDQPPATLCDHVPQRCDTAEVYRLGIHAHYRIPMLFGDIKRKGHALNAGVVHQRIQPAKFGQRRIDHMLAISGIGDINR